MLNDFVHSLRIFDVFSRFVYDLCKSLVSLTFLHVLTTSIMFMEGFRHFCRALEVRGLESQMLMAFKG